MLICWYDIPGWQTIHSKCQIPWHPAGWWWCYKYFFWCLFASSFCKARAEKNYRQIAPKTICAFFFLPHNESQGENEKRSTPRRRQRMKVLPWTLAHSLGKCSPLDPECISSGYMGFSNAKFRNQCSHPSLAIQSTNFEAEGAPFFELSSFQNFHDGFAVAWPYIGHGIRAAWDWIFASLVGWADRRWVILFPVGHKILLALCFFLIQPANFAHFSEGAESIMLFASLKFVNLNYFYHYQLPSHELFGSWSDVVK